MKLLSSIQLSPVASAAGGMTGMDSRLTPGRSLSFNPDLFWRAHCQYGFSLNFSPTTQPSPSPFLDFKTHLPTSLVSDPRLWSREDVAVFLRWAEQEFDLPPFDMDVFQMNGKALCLLTKADMGERCPSAGDVLHNVLSMLVRDHNQLQRCLPSSPVTPTRPSAYSLGPLSHPPPLTWTETPPYAQNLASLMSANSVTLSPAPSVDSQSGSPSHAIDANQMQVYRSDSDEDNNHQASSGNSSPPPTPTALTAQKLSEVSVKDQPSPTLPSQLMPLTPGAFRSTTTANTPREFFPNDSPESPNTNGRLLWDFLQQLLNDPQQRYHNFIAWKSRDTGVFKIVDPPGLARLWGIQKNHLSMNYDKMSRALRYYYRVNILRKVQGERHCYQFLRNSVELKNIKNISSLRHQMRIKSEPEEEGAFFGSPEIEPEADMPTDLSMSSMNQSSNEQQHQQPLPLHDPPAKYRSHACNLVQTNQEPEERK